MDQPWKAPSSMPSWISSRSPWVWPCSASCSASYQQLQPGRQALEPPAHRVRLVLCLAIRPRTPARADGLLVTLWGLRLTWNFSRREDIPGSSGRVRRTTDGPNCAKMPMFSKSGDSPVQSVFHLPYQQHLILLFTLPALVAWRGPTSPWAGWTTWRLP